MLNAIHDCLVKENYEEALRLSNAALEEKPDSAELCNFIGYAWLNLGHEALGYQFFRRALEITPQNAKLLVNYGKCLHEMGRYHDAIQTYLKAASLEHDNPKAYANAAASMVQLSRWEDAEKMARSALEIDPNEFNAKLNLAHCLLAKGEFGEGFDLFELSLGKSFRKEWVYGNETRWNGEKGKNVCVYGEQGLGEEIIFSQCLPQLAKDSNKVYLDCDPRLETLFRRSFPQVEVHGTRRDKELKWLETAQIDHRAAIGSLATQYLRSAENFAIEPYLKPDQDKVLMWRALFDSWNKPVIGLCFKSGSKGNNQEGRTLTVSDYKPLTCSIEAEFISLEYLDDPDGIRHYPFATKSKDYDDTASLIAALDCVVGICTTAMHCAEAVGTPTITLVPERHNWKFAGQMPHAGIHWKQNGSWINTIDKLVRSKTLNAYL